MDRSGVKERERKGGRKRRRDMEWGYKEEKRGDQRGEGKEEEGFGIGRMKEGTRRGG